MIPGFNDYFPHVIREKFFQCDKEGRAFARTCPLGLRWMQESLTCIPITQSTTPTTTTTRTSTTTTTTSTIVPFKKVIQPTVDNTNKVSGVSNLPIDESKITSFSRAQINQNINPHASISKSSPTSRILRRKNQIKLNQNI